MSLLYCSLTRAASNWYNRLPQVYRNNSSSFTQVFKQNNSILKIMHTSKLCIYLKIMQIEALSLVKNENVRHYALKVETRDQQGWYNEYFSTINLKSNEIFTRDLPKKVKDFANKRQFKHISSSLEPFIPFHSLVNIFDSEDITLEKNKTQELS